MKNLGKIGKPEKGMFHRLTIRYLSHGTAQMCPVDQVQQGLNLRPSLRQALRRINFLNLQLYYSLHSCMHPVNSNTETYRAPYRNHKYARVSITAPWF